MAIKIPLTKDQFAIVDDDMESQVAHKLWFCDSGYAARTIHGRNDEPNRKEFLHDFIMQPPEGLVVDHRNGVRGDCRRVNLRFATDQQNFMNKGMNSRNTSGVRGVHWNKKLSRWSARISCAGIKKSLGDFFRIEDADAAYKAAAVEYYGEYARHLSNVPEPVITKILSRAKHGRNNSGHTGICFDKRTQKWIATIVRKGKNVFYARFVTMQEAIDARAKAVIELMLAEQKLPPSVQESPEEVPRTSDGHINNKSGHEGVCWDKRNNRWLAFLTRDNKSVLYKNFKNLDDAIKARADAEKEYNERVATNPPIPQEPMLPDEPLELFD